MDTELYSKLEKLKTLIKTLQMILKKDLVHQTMKLIDLCQ